MAKYLLSVSLFGVLCVLALPAVAQDSDPAAMAAAVGDITAQPDLSAELGIDPEKYKGLAPEEILLIKVQEQMKSELKRLDELKPDIPSLFFTEQQYLVLQNAMNGFEQNMDMSALRNQSGGELLDTLPDGDNPFAAFREISLSGIVYNSAEDWIVWLNKQRLTPKRLPPQIQDIKVQKEFVDIKWYDQQTKQLIPIRLRPNQRFNLDTRIFLPG